jgi:hypothetical protein
MHAHGDNNLFNDDASTEEVIQSRIRNGNVITNGKRGNDVKRKRQRCVLSHWRTLTAAARLGGLRRTAAKWDRIKL